MKAKKSHLLKRVVMLGTLANVEANDIENKYTALHCTALHCTALAHACKMSEQMKKMHKKCT